MASNTNGTSNDIYIINGTTLINIADATRVATESTDKMSMDSISDKIINLGNENKNLKTQVNNLTTENEQLETQISNGKSVIANSITDNGVNTSTSASFETMADNIDSVATNKYNAGVTATKKGTATAENVLTGKTFTNASGVNLSGTMPNNGQCLATITPKTTSQEYTIPKGFHDGTGKVTVNGAPTSLIDGDATAENVLTGKKFFVDSYTAKTGTMPNNGSVSESLNCGDSYTIPKGYHDGSGKVTANSLSSQTQATATASDILSGKTAYVNGSKITGTTVLPPNGKTWTQCANTSGVTFTKIACGNGIFVAIGGSGIYYSTDGMNWIQTSITTGQTSKYSKCLHYANGMWVASNSQGLVYSTDGKYWYNSNITNDESVYFAKYANGMWVAGGSGSQRLFYSTDGKNWTVFSNLPTGTFYNADYANGIWVFASSSGLPYSTDGKTITTSSLSSTFYDVHYADKYWIAAGNTAYYNLLYSTTGKSWSNSNITSGTFDKIHYGEDGTTITSGLNSALYYSTDRGQKWTKCTGGANSNYGMYYANGMWVAGQSNALYYSTNGKSWTKSNITGYTFYDVYNAKGIWVAVGSNGIYYSKSS